MNPSTPPTHVVPTSFDPLSPAASTSASAPISFKRRTPSRSFASRTGLLGGILSRSDDTDADADRVPAPILQRPDAPGHIAIPPSPLLDGNAVDQQEEEEGEWPRAGGGKWPQRLRAASGTSRGIGRAGSGMRSSMPSRWEGGAGRTGSPGRGGDGGEEEEEEGGEEEVVVATPLPTLSILVLCIAMFGEFLSASTSSPFLYFMIQEFGVGQGPDGGGEAAVGFWAGIVSSVFFLSQFLTSLLWVSVAEKHGRRAVLFSSLLGNALTLAVFGTSKNLGTAICVRLAMGIFNGAVGVARSAVQSITDPSNESAAFTYMGLSWGLGGIVGSIVGGLAENPARNYPRFFGESVLFADYPYLLPCLISSSVTLLGALLSLFLNEDGGPRDRGIQLPTEKEVFAAFSAFSLPRKLFRTLRSFAVRQEAPISLPVSPVPLHRASSAPGREPELERPIQHKASQYGSAFNGFQPLSLRRTSGATRASGSAYGYEQRPRFPSMVRRNTGRSGLRVGSAGTSTRYAPDYDDVEHQEPNFAQRLLLANEPAVFSISDLWVSAATRADEQFSQAYSESVFEDDDDDAESRIGIDETGEEPDFFGYGSAPPSVVPSREDLRGEARRQDEERSRSETLAVPRPDSPSLSAPRERSTSGERDGRVFSYGTRAGERLRRASVASSAPRGPALFANTGLDPSSLGMASPGLPTARVKDDTPGESTFNFNPLAAIPEQRAPSIIEIEAGTAGEVSTEKPESLIRQLPLAMIAQYALLALHGTTCDQVFLSFLVTPIPAGGLGLQASNYAMLVAAMFFFQTLWQFRFYPFVSAPRGPFSHLAMFRLGLFLYLPVYFLFPELRGLLVEGDSNFSVMMGMTLLSAIRYLASTCAYTAVMVLINAMSPPHLVPLGNGLAQSAVSLARFVGPLLGGTMWAASIANGPNAHAYPFNYAFGFIVIGVICGVGFLHSFRIH